jgi:uncharacterized damage-inducible protein DinB
MNAKAFRHLYEYHFAENRKIWDRYVTQLSLAQFTPAADYSHGSVRDQIIHLISVHDTRFSDLRGMAVPQPLSPADLPDLESIRGHWDAVERNMRDCLSELRDEMLFTNPLGGEDRELILWQVLLHVVNHGTDHRAQLLRLLNDLGVETASQDYISFAHDHSVWEPSSRPKD